MIESNEWSQVWKVKREERILDWMTQNILDFSFKTFVEIDISFNFKSVLTCLLPICCQESVSGSPDCPRTEGSGGSQQDLKQTVRNCRKI